MVSGGTNNLFGVGKKDIQVASTGIQYVVLLLRVENPGDALVNPAGRDGPCIHFGLQGIDVIIVELGCFSTVQIPGNEQHIHACVDDFLSQIGGVLHAALFSGNQSRRIEGVHLQSVSHNHALIAHLLP